MNISLILDSIVHTETDINLQANSVSDTTTKPKIFEEITFSAIQATTAANQNNQ